MVTSCCRAFHILPAILRSDAACVWQSVAAVATAEVMHHAKKPRPDDHHTNMLYQLQWALGSQLLDCPPAHVCLMLHVTHAHVCQPHGFIHGCIHRLECYVSCRVGRGLKLSKRSLKQTGQPSCPAEHREKRQLAHCQVWGDASRTTTASAHKVRPPRTSGLPSRLGVSGTAQFRLHAVGAGSSAYLLLSSSCDNASVA